MKATIPDMTKSGTPFPTSLTPILPLRAGPPDFASATPALDPAEVGRRLRSARETAGMTQAEAAASIRVARTTLLAIEKGQRRLQPAELQQLAVAFGTSANELLRRESVHMDLARRFRKGGRNAEAEAGEAARVLVGLVRAEVELENLLGVQRPRNYPAERPLLPGDIRVQAESDALHLRHRIGLGLAPVRDIESLLELEFGVRIYVQPLRSRLSGLFAYDTEGGACMLLNANHRQTRRSLTAAHELAHLVSARHATSIQYRDHLPKSRAEFYAAAFASSFLMPPRTVMEKFREYTSGFSALTPRHVILLSRTFGVSREAMVRRIEELKVVPPGAWDWFQANGVIADDEAAEVRGGLAPAGIDAAKATHRLPVRITALAAEAHRQELLSEGQLARLLGLDRVALRQVLDAEAGEGEADAAAPLAR